MGFEYTPEQIVPRKSLAEKGRKLHEEFKSLDLDEKSFREFLLDRGFTEKRARKILVAMQQDEEEVFEPIEEFFQEEIPAEEVAEILGAKSSFSNLWKKNKKGKVKLASKPNKIQWVIFVVFIAISLFVIIVSDFRSGSRYFSIDLQPLLFLGWVVFAGGFLYRAFGNKR